MNKQQTIDLLVRIGINNKRISKLELDLRGADLRGANLCYADLRGADLRYANLHYANLYDADLHYADLHYADLHYANLYDADLRYADLYDADLHYANLCYANLHGADLRYADLHGADLHGADLRYADLRGADLHGADLRYADLRGADLHGADLTKTCLDPKNKPNGMVDEFEKQGKYVIGYRSPNSKIINSNHVWEKEKWHTAPYFSTSNTECHPGLYLKPDYELGDIAVKSLAKDVHKAGSKYRTKKFYVYKHNWRNVK
jgi:hypothetical protein